MRFLSIQPDIDYYIWQLDVQMNNFRKYGIEDKAIIILGYTSDFGINDNAKEFADRTSATVLFVEDTRNMSERLYIPSIQPHLMKKICVQNSQLFDHKQIFFHDADMLFTMLPNLSDLEDNSKVYLSDTTSYIGAKYIKSKSSKLFKEMCDIVGISTVLVESNEEQSGGAQYFFPSIFMLSSDFWDKVEKDSNALFKHMIATSSLYNPEFPIQSWTAGMWALLWNIWLIGIETEISKELDFSWATSPIEEIQTKNIFHNAGVVSGNDGLFFKGDYFNKSPFGVDFSNVNPNKCSYYYAKEIMETAKMLKS